MSSSSSAFRNNNRSEDLYANEVNTVMMTIVNNTLVMFSDIEKLIRADYKGQRTPDNMGYFFGVVDKTLVERVYQIQSIVGLKKNKQGYYEPMRVNIYEFFSNNRSIGVDIANTIKKVRELIRSTVCFNFGVIPKLLGLGKEMKINFKEPKDVTYDDIPDVIGKCKKLIGMNKESYHYTSDYILTVLEEVGNVVGLYNRLEEEDKEDKEELSRYFNRKYQEKVTEFKTYVKSNVDDVNESLDKLSSIDNKLLRVSNNTLDQMKKVFAVVKPNNEKGAILLREHVIRNIKSLEEWDKLSAVERKLYVDSEMEKEVAVVDVMDAVKAVDTVDVIDLGESDQEDIGDDEYDEYQQDQQPVYSYNTQEEEEEDEEDEEEEEEGGNIGRGSDLVYEQELRNMREYQQGIDLTQDDEWENDPFQSSSSKRMKEDADVRLSPSPPPSVPEPKLAPESSCVIF